MTDKEERIVPQSSITEDLVKEALRADKGSYAALKSWKVVDFTKPGDNYACVVTSVEVKYSKFNKDYEVSYVVKLNAQRKIEGVPDFTPFVFHMEGKFYEEVLPALNETLAAAGQKPLQFPKCFLVSLEEGKQQIYFEDLRVRNFKMFDRRKGMDKDHATLVLEELARLHGASHILKKFNQGTSIAKKFEFLSKNYFEFFDEFKQLFVPMFQAHVDTGIKVLEKVGGYQTAVNWLESYKSEAEDIFFNIRQGEKFDCISHGDCWNNNILFRYDDKGHPVEVILLDLQGCRDVSLSCDLNYFLYTSLTGEVRRPNLDSFLSAYHSTYSQVVKAASLPMPFKKDELVKEFRDKNKFGLLFAMGIVPALLMEPEEVPDMEDMDAQTIAKFMEKWRQMALDKLDTNPLCKPRYLSIIDELMETGLIS